MLSLSKHELAEAWEPQRDDGAIGTFLWRADLIHIKRTIVRESKTSPTHACPLRRSEGR